MDDAIKEFRMLAGLEPVVEDVELRSKNKYIRASQVDLADLAEENRRLQLKIRELEDERDELYTYCEALVSKVKALTEGTAAPPMIMDSLPGLQDVARDQYTSPHRRKPVQQEAVATTSVSREARLLELVNDSPPMRE